MNQLLDTELEVIISMIDTFEIYTEGTETIEKYGKFENDQILAGDYDIECTVHVQPVYINVGITAENEPTKELYRNDVSVMEALLYKEDDIIRLTLKQTLRLEDAIENKITVFPRP